MAVTYTDYERAIRTISFLAEGKRRSDREVEARLAEAKSAAHEIPRQAVKQTEVARSKVQQQQAEGRSALQRIEQADLLPARVRPGKSVGDVSGVELDKLVRQHAQAVARLQTAISDYEEAVNRESLRRQAEAQREAEERSRRRAEEKAERLRREEEARAAAEAARQAAEEEARRRRQRFWLAITGCAVALVLIVLMIVLL